MGNYWDNLMDDDDHAANYMETYGEGSGAETRHLLASFINDGDSVLDVGCGPGWNLDHFMAHGPAIRKYKGIDYSERFVRVANKRAMEKAGTASGPFEVGDCRKLKQYDGQYDVVILQDVLEHTNGYERPVREALRVAAKRVIVVFWRPFNENGQDDINDDGNDGYGATYDRAKWEKFVDSLGYTVTDTETPAGANRWHKYYIIDKEEPK
jgi:ubiquinone/menaquinone biosynthesis C-methylase UbiE